MSMNHDKRDFRIVIFWNYFVFSRLRWTIWMQNLPSFPTLILDLPHFARQAVNTIKTFIYFSLIADIELQFVGLLTVCASNFFRFCERSRKLFNIFFFLLHFYLQKLISLYVNVKVTKLNVEYEFVITERLFFASIVWLVI